MSTEHLNPDSSPIQDKEWEASMLSFVEQETDDKKSSPPGKKHSLHRRSLTVIFSSIGALLLAAVLLVVTLCIQPQQPDDGGDSGSSDVTVATKPAIPLLNNAGDADKNIIAKPMQRVDIQNTSDSFSIVYDETEKTYVLEEYEDLTLSSSLLLTLRKYTETIQAQEKVAVTTNIAAFGLDKPQATAAITYSDGSVARIRVGNMTPSETGFYGQFGDSDDVYIFESDAVAMFRFRATAFVNTQLITTPTVKSTDKSGIPLLRNATFSGTAHPTPLSLRRSNENDTEELSYFNYLISAPYLRATSDTAANNIGQFKSLEAIQALILHPTKEQKKQLGFDDPLIRIDATLAVETEEETDDDSENTQKIYYNAVDYRITVGSLNDDGNYIVMVDSVDAIFLVSKADYGYFFDITYHNTVNQYLFFKKIDMIGRIVVRINEDTHEFSLTHYPDAEKPDDQLVVKSKDKVYSTEEFRELYGLMLALERYGTAAANPTGDVPLELTLYDTQGDVYLSAKYYNTSGSLCTVETNEGELFTTRWGYVSFFIQQVENYVNGKDVLVNT